MQRTITRLFDSHSQAMTVVEELEASGVPHEDISIIASNADNWHTGHRHPQAGLGEPSDPGNEAAEDAGKGAAIGAGLGGAAGLLAGLGVLAIPGVGPVAAAGWLSATVLGAIAGAAAGGATGGLIGALREAGETDEDAQVYAEGVRRGGSIVSVRIDDDDRQRVIQILDRNLGVDAATRGRDYREQGWTRFDETAEPYGEDAIRAERARYDRSGLGETRTFADRDEAPAGGLSQDDTGAAGHDTPWIAPGQTPRV